MTDNYRGTGYLIAFVDSDGACAQVSVLCSVCVCACVCVRARVEQCDSGEAYMPRTQTDGQWGEGFNGLAVNKTSNLLLKLSLLWGTCVANGKRSRLRLFSLVFISFFSFRFNFLIVQRWWNIAAHRTAS